MKFLVEAFTPKFNLYIYLRDKKIKFYTEKDIEGIAVLKLN